MARRPGFAATRRPSSQSVAVKGSQTGEGPAAAGVCEAGLAMALMARSTPCLEVDVVELDRHRIDADLGRCDPARELPRLVPRLHNLHAPPQSIPAGQPLVDAGREGRLVQYRPVRAHVAAGIGPD